MKTTKTRPRVLWRVTDRFSIVRRRGTPNVRVYVYVVAAVSAADAKAIVARGTGSVPASRTAKRCGARLILTACYHDRPTTLETTTRRVLGAIVTGAMS